MNRTGKCKHDDPKFVCLRFRALRLATWLTFHVCTLSHVYALNKRYFAFTTVAFTLTNVARKAGFR